MPLCNSCYDDYYTTCECCGRIIHRDYANYDDDDDCAYCDRCYEERQNSSIHEYNYKPEPIFYGDSKRYFGVELEIDEGGKNSDNADTLLGIGNRIAEHIYIKSDGSLSDGMEIVDELGILSQFDRDFGHGDTVHAEISYYIIGQSGMESERLPDEFGCDIVSHLDAAVQYADLLEERPLTIDFGDYEMSFE